MVYEKSVCMTEVDSRQFMIDQLISELCNDSFGSIKRLARMLAPGRSICELALRGSSVVRPSLAVAVETRPVRQMLSRPLRMSVRGAVVTSRRALCRVGGCEQGVGDGAGLVWGYVDVPLGVCFALS